MDELLRKMGEALNMPCRKACDTCTHEDESGLHEPCNECICMDWRGEQPSGWEPKGVAS